MINIAVFASGYGSNAQKIFEYFGNFPNYKISLVLSNNKDAFVLKRAEIFKIDSVIVSREDFYKSDIVLNILKTNKIDFIVLAGFMWLIPSQFINSFSNKIINIHPALLPKFGGKGMYGDFVHQSVKNSGTDETGISIHFVNEKYDEGDIIFQEKCRILDSDSVEDIAFKVHELEYKFYPSVIKGVCDNLFL